MFRFKIVCIIDAVHFALYQHSSIIVILSSNVSLSNMVINQPKAATYYTNCLHSITLRTYFLTVIAIMFEYANQYLEKGHL